ncbi:uracil-DNA glycosylase family protein [Variovorax dokdonensis]|uniref:Uracil-DNA glycosylase family protein n=1 Tax=Variovorax dokdonensis TaxID=344883 RepID=A0ABT7NCQ4_9BURK|nr:uracil-DNA glycosylase family protein [Variovorax dokdonensis]MDM0045713.1 uracil-DNA glycosylase family protein [Variovorax dokdonensis]
MTTLNDGQASSERVVLSPPTTQLFRELAARLEMLDRECYSRLSRDPLQPILGLGAANSRWCFIGRDPGEQEVHQQWPFVGESGARIRAVMDEFHLSDADVFWMNTVPYKPKGNKAWRKAVRKEFQPALLELLAAWQGTRVITFGEQAFSWFGLRNPEVASALRRFWTRADKYKAEIAVTLQIGQVNRQFAVCPLPHPSKANASWVKAFPDLLRERLSAADDGSREARSKFPSGCG